MLLLHSVKERKIAFVPASRQAGLNWMFELLKIMKNEALRLCS